MFFFVRVSSRPTSALDIPPLSIPPESFNCSKPEIKPETERAERAERAESTERNIRRLDGIQGLYIRGNTAYQLVPALETRFLAFLPRGRWWRCRTDSYRTTPAPHLIEVTIQCPKKQQLFNNKKTTMCSKKRVEKRVEKRVQKEWSKNMVTKYGHK